MTFCDVHRMPGGERGCPQCVRDEAMVYRAERNRFWRWAGAVFGIIFALAALTLVLFPPRRPSDKLDPAPFRPAIESVESALYSTDRLGGDDQAALQAGLFDLQVRLRKTVPSAAQRRAQEGLQKFCTLTPVLAEQDSFDLSATRREWEALRRAHFLPAPWFRTSSQALEQAQTSASARGIPADAGLYQPALDGLRLLEARAEAELAQLPDDPEDLNSSAYDRWRAARPEVLADIERLRREQPVRFSGMNPGWRRAWDDLDRATREVAGMLRATTYTRTLVPTASEGRMRILRVRALLDQAQASLDAAPR